MINNLWDYISIQVAKCPTVTFFGTEHASACSLSWSHRCTSMNACAGTQMKQSGNNLSHFDGDPLLFFTKVHGVEAMSLFSTWPSLRMSETGTDLCFFGTIASWWFLDFLS